MKKVAIFSMTALASATLLTGFVQQTVAHADSTPVANIGSETITQDQLFERLKKDAGVVTLRSMILQKVLEQNSSDAAKAKEEADKEVADQIEKVGGEEAFQKLLTAQKLGSVEDFKQQIYVRKLFNEVVDAKIDKSEEAVKAYYDNQYQPKMEAQHILVETEDEAKAAIERLNNGETFETIAKEISKDSSAKSGGTLTPFTTGQMVSEFEEAVKSQKNGEVTQTPVKSKFGYHVIKTINNGEKKPYDEIKDEVTKEYVDSKIKDQNFSYRIVGQLIKDAKVEIKDEDLKDAVKDLVELADKPVESSSAAPASSDSATESSSSN